MEGVEGRAGQVGRAPFAGARVLVEGPEGIPVLRLDGLSGKRADGQAVALRGFAFLADHLALAAGKLAQKIAVTGVAAVFPVELLGDAVHQAHLSVERPRLRRRCRR